MYINIDVIPTIAQYIANHINLPRLTILIINLHATNPAMNAETKPAIIFEMSTELILLVPIASRKLTPKIGTIIIKNENLATSSLFTPSNSPVDIVEPERDNPGSTAQA